MEKGPKKIACAIEVMEYQMGTPKNDYWWWTDGLYMVMPVMTKLHKVTGNKLYLKKLHEYLSYANSIMYDPEEKLYFRDAKYVYPKYKSVNGKKDFRARGDGWFFAGIAKVLPDLPKQVSDQKKYLQRFRDMAKAIAASQQPAGYLFSRLIARTYIQNAFCVRLTKGLILHRYAKLAAALLSWILP